MDNSFTVLLRSSARLKVYSAQFVWILPIDYIFPSPFLVLIAKARIIAYNLHPYETGHRMEPVSGKEMKMALALVVLGFAVSGVRYGDVFQLHISMQTHTCKIRMFPHDEFRECYIL